MIKFIDHIDENVQIILQHTVYNLCWYLCICVSLLMQESNTTLLFVGTAVTDLVHHHHLLHHYRSPRRRCHFQTPEVKTSYSYECNQNGVNHVNMKERLWCDCVFLMLLSSHILLETRLTDELSLICWLWGWFGFVIWDANVSDLNQTCHQQ